MSSGNSLKKYHEKRDFRCTSEPAGGSKRSSGKPIFVIQKQAATNLHYDFRLEGEEADARRNPTSTQPRSVQSYRTLDEIKEQEGNGQP